MKKVLSLILTLSMLLSMATVVGTSVSAETDVYNITFDKLDEVASTNTFCELSSDVRIGTKGNSLCFKESNMTRTEYLTNDSARRTYPVDLGDGFNGGTYSISVWLNITTAEYMSFWISFHSSEETDKSIGYKLKNASTKTLICDRKKGIGDYVGDLLSTSNVNGNWREYVTELYIPEGTKYVCFWDNYGKAYSSSNGGLFFVDNVTLTKVDGALGSFDDAEGFNNPTVMATGYFEGSETAFHTAGGKSAVLKNEAAEDEGYNLDSNHIYMDNFGGTHRTKLKNLSNSVPAGLYKVSVWILDNSNDGIDCQLLISFHGPSTKEDGTDEALNVNFTKDNTSSITKIYDTNDRHYLYYDIGGDAFEQGHLNAYKSVLQSTGRKESCGDGNVWCEYSGLISVALTCTQYSLWFYRPLNYDGEIKTSNEEPMYVDDVLLTSYTPADDSIYFYNEEGDLLDEYTMEDYLADLNGQHYENEVLKYKTGLFDNEFKNIGKRVWSLLTPQGYVIGQAITTFFHNVGDDVNPRKYPNEMYWNNTTKKYEITVTARDESVFDIVVSYDDKTVDGVIDHLYFNSVMFDDGELLHTKSYWSNLGVSHYFDMYRFGLLFAEDDEARGNKHYATDNDLKLYEHGGYPLFVKANPESFKLGKSIKDEDRALGWFDSVLESCDGKGAYIEDTVPLELTAQNMIENSMESGDLEAKLVAFRWDNFPAYDKIGVRMFYVTATNYTVYADISYLSFTEGVPVLPLHEMAINSEVNQGRAIIK